jgi:hypothetical protein
MLMAPPRNGSGNVGLSIWMPITFGGVNRALPMMLSTTWS